MAYATSFNILHGNFVTMPVEEGAWTDNDDYKEGGYFATPLKEGDYVILDGTVDFRVQKAASTETPIGVVVGAPMGKNVANGRSATIELFCYRVMKVKLSATSQPASIGEYVCYDAANEWCQTATANSTAALQAIAADAEGYVMIGKYSVAGTKAVA